MNSKKIIFPVLLVCAGFILTLQRNDARPAQARPVSENISYKEIDAYIERQLKSLNIPGAAFAIVEGNEIVHLQGFGQAHPGGEAPTPKTPFYIGSTTKSITALAVMQLVEAGKIDLDAPIQRYLPWFRIANPRAAGQITVRHLLNQTSGLSMTVGTLPLANFDNRPGAAERQARSLAHESLTRPAGSAYEYSNMNYNLLGLIIAAASGEPYERYIQSHIFDPLEMKHSYTSRIEARQNGLAMGHVLWFGFPVAVPNQPVPAGSLPSGQLISSVEDMAHYLIAHLNQGRYKNIHILSPEGIAELHQPVIVPKVTAEKGAYSMGWVVEETGQGTRLSHAGQVPDFFAYMTLLPDQKRGMILLANGNHFLTYMSLLQIGSNVSSLLANEHSGLASLSITLWIIRAFLILPILQIIDVLVTLRLLSRWRRNVSRRPEPARAWAFHIPVTLHLIIVLVMLGMFISGRITALLVFMPDLSWLFLTCSGFALVWIFLRTRWILRAVGNEGNRTICKNV